MPVPHRSYAEAVALGPVRVGHHQPVVIIAEAGVNHDGDIEQAMALVDAAADAGADGVKFQWFSAADLVSGDTPAASYQRRACGDVSQREMLHRLELNHSDFRRIKERCSERNILLLVTPFGVRQLDGLIALDVPGIKIASTDLTNIPLLVAACKTGRPIILSTGASLESEIHEAVDRLQREGADDRLILMHCVSRYPTPIKSLNLAAIGTLASAFGRPVGLSDHTTSTQTGGWAVAAGACILEKHFTLTPSGHGPDHAMSLDPCALARYIDAARQAQQALGAGRIGMTDLESETRQLCSRSVVAAVDIPCGTKLTRELLTLKRSSGGIGSLDLSGLFGRSAASDIPADTALSWDMVR